MATVQPVNQILFDRGVRHAVLLEQLKNSEKKRVVTLLEQSRKDVTERLQVRLENIKTRGHDTGPETTRRLSDMLSSIDGMLATVMEDLKTGSISNAEAIAQTEAQFQSKAITDAIPAELEFDAVTPSSNQLRTMVSKRMMQGQFVPEVWDQFGDKQRTRVKSSIMKGITQGEPIPTITKRVNNDFQVAKYQATAVTRTIVNHTTTQAREMVYDDNRDLVKGVRIVATLDTRTSDICRGQDGKVYPVGEGPRPPFHYNCRTTTVPEIKSFKELGLNFKELSPTTRASMNGAVLETVNYNDWLKTQTPSLQDEALGKAKGDLFRAGKIEASSVDSIGKSLTLEDLQVKEGLRKERKKEAKKPVHQKIAEQADKLHSESTALADKAQMLASDADALLAKAKAEEKVPVAVEEKIQAAKDAVVSHKGLSEEEIWVKSLSYKQIQAVRDWTGSGYKEIKSLQRGLLNNDEVRNTLSSLTEAYNLAPKYDGPIWRGFSLPKEELDSFLKGEELVLDSFTSMSSSFESSYSFLNDSMINDPSGKVGVILHVKQNTIGRKIDFLSVNKEQFENEVLVEGGAKYKISKVEKTFSKSSDKFEIHNVYLEESEKQFAAAKDAVVPQLSAEVSPVERFKTQREWESSLSSEHKELLEEWSYDSQNFRSFQNGSEQTDNALRVDQVKFTKFESALSRAPVSEKQLYRGITIDPDGYKQLTTVGNETVLNSWSSFTSDVSQTTDFIQTVGDRKGIVFSWRNGKGIDVSNLVAEEFQDQKEHLVSRGTRLVVEKVVPHGDYSVVFVKEAEPIAKSVVESITKTATESHVQDEAISRLGAVDLVDGKFLATVESSLKDRIAVYENDLRLVHSDFAKERIQKKIDDLRAQLGKLDTKTATENVKLSTRTVEDVKAKLKLKDEVQEAIKPLDSQKTYKEWENSLTEDQKYAIGSWTGQDYSEITSYQSDPIGFEKARGADYTAKIRKLSTDVETALADAPKYTGQMFRGVVVDQSNIDKWVADGKIQWDRTSAFSKLENIAEGGLAPAYDAVLEYGDESIKNTTRKVIFQVDKSVYGVDISKLPDSIDYEEEVLDPFGAKYKIKRVTKKDDITYIHLEHEGSPTTKRRKRK